MKYESISDIYSANAKTREQTIALAESISDAEAKALPDGEKWSIQNIFEHVAIVDSGAIRIAERLLSSARESGKLSDGSFSLSENFSERSAAIADRKVEAPDRVHPTGSLEIRDALAKLEANLPAFHALREDLETFDLTVSKFPHPFFGDLTAAEWLVVRNGHEARHTAQIDLILARIRS